MLSSSRAGNPWLFGGGSEQPRVSTRPEHTQWIPVAELVIKLQLQSASRVTEHILYSVLMEVTSPSWLLRSSRVMTLDEINYHLGHSAVVKSLFAVLTEPLLIYQSINPSINPLFTFI